MAAVACWVLWPLFL